MRRLAAAALVVAAACSQGDAATTTTTEPREFGFVDVAAEVGLGFRHAAFRWSVSADPAAMMGGGVCWLDADGDGWLDLYLVNTWSLDEWGRWDQGDGLPTGALYRNDEGRFTDVTAAADLALPARGAGCVAADLDGDGHTDLYVTSERANLLFWNDGDGTFTEGAEAAGVAAFGWQAGAAAGDLDGDQRLDLVVTGYADLNNRKEGSASGFPGSYLGRRDLLFHNLGGRAFAEVGEAAGLDGGGELEYGLGVVLDDLDGDGDLDVYVANDTNPNRLYANVTEPGGSIRLDEVSGFSPTGDDRSGMGVAPGDLDGDGRTDLLVTNLGRQTHSLYLEGMALRPGPVEIGGATGWGATWADFDHDADLDLLVVTGEVPIADLAADARNPILHLGPDLATQPAGSFQTGAMNARGSAAADYDNDGDLDVAVNQVGGQAVLLENVGTKGNWLVVDLGGPHPGARLTATLPDGRALHRTVHAGSSYVSSEDPRVHFGLGDADLVAELAIRWPDGGRTALEDVAAGQVVRVAR